MYTTLKEDRLDKLNLEIEVLENIIKGYRKEVRHLYSLKNSFIDTLNESYKFYLLFPSNYDNLNKVDQACLDEYNAAVLLGFNIILFDFDHFIETGELKTNDVYFNENAMVLYRGWMMKVGGRDCISDLFQENYSYPYLYSAFNGKLINNDMQYAICHYYSLSERLFSKFSRNNINACKPYKSLSYVRQKWHLPEEERIQETLNRFEEEFKKYHPFVYKKDREKSYIIKDACKSEKGTEFFMLNPGDNFRTKIYGFIKLRQKLFTGHLVLKEVLKLKRNENNKAFELRAFVIFNKILKISCNSDFDFEYDQSAMDLIQKVVQCDIGSNFYTIDIMQLEDGSWIVNELGDGQVSGLASQENPVVFYNLLKNYLIENNLI